MKPLLTSALILSLSLFTSMAAHADQVVTFKVPVKLDKLDPQVTGFAVGCDALDNISNTMAGGHSATVAVPSGSYSGVIAVPVTVPANRVVLVKGYSCFVLLFGPNGGNLMNTLPYTNATPNSVGTVNGPI